jgi:uncharacterized membrane protein
VIVAISLHTLAAVIWVGGMFFAYTALRPAAAGVLEAAQRLPLWSQTLGRFFSWVWAAAITLPVTGYWMVFTHFGGLAHAGLSIHFMQAAGILMILIFLHVFFAPFRRMRRALTAGDLQAAAHNLNQIRHIVFINLLLGIIVSIVGAAGPYWSL